MRCGRLRSTLRPSSSDGLEREQLGTRIGFDWEPDRLWKPEGTSLATGGPGRCLPPRGRGRKGDVAQRNAEGSDTWPPRAMDAGTPGWTGDRGRGLNPEPRRLSEGIQISNRKKTGMQRGKKGCPSRIGKGRDDPPGPSSTVHFESSPDETERSRSRSETESVPCEARPPDPTSRRQAVLRRGCSPTTLSMTGPWTVGTACPSECVPFRRPGTGPSPLSTGIPSWESRTCRPGRKGRSNQDVGRGVSGGGVTARFGSRAPRSRGVRGRSEGGAGGCICRIAGALHRRHRHASPPFFREEIQTREGAEGTCRCFRTVQGSRWGGAAPRDTTRHHATPRWEREVGGRNEVDTTTAGTRTKC
eukprot:scaffold587_cov339-Pavlova_lutheri.AAC.40